MLRIFFVTLVTVLKWKGLVNDMWIKEAKNTTPIKTYLVDKEDGDGSVLYNEYEMKEIADYVRYIDLQKFVKEYLIDSGYSKYGLTDKLLSNILKIMIQKGYETTQDIDYILEEMPASQVLDIL